MFTAAFWGAAFERAIKSGAQSLLLLWGADGGLDLFHVSLPEAGSFALGAMALSLLSSVVSSKVGGPGPSLGAEVVKPQ